MTDGNRTSDRGQLWIYLLVGLAIIATVIMLFTDSNAALKLALIAALWAAAIGFFLVSRYRRDKLEAEHELELVQATHEAELKAVEAEANTDKRALELVQTAEGKQLVPADTELLREIREELAAIRSQLEDLAGREFGYEPAALQAEARRILELQAKAASAFSPVAEPAQSPAYSEEDSVTTAFAAVPSVADEPGEQEPLDDEPDEIVAEEVTDEVVAEEAEPEAEPEVEPEPEAEQDNTDAEEAEEDAPAPAPAVARAPSADAVAGRVGGFDEAQNRKPNPLSQLISERREEAAAEESAAEEEESQSRRGRRRRDEHSEGSVSVAELLARARKENN
ncbi:hypothetical protein QP027_09690 [Corynebacterium breve]|uniref:DUF6779 domain-containing protein n=1 Tax=Corynebacterium breve TaxID=3049799 RepID=A0ABY8VCG5_9CORY|nr:DUF6779 domain-containing protein [Corynebacterium breve]WIM67365.1 hypothetical protein QP027_09690 [Corynebacterium breve]